MISYVLLRVTKSKIIGCTDKPNHFFIGNRIQKGAVDDATIVIESF